MAGHANRRALPASCPSPAAAAAPSASSSPSPSPLFMCCVSLPGPLQPLSLPPPSPSSSSSPSSSCSSTSSSADLPPSHALPALSKFSHSQASKSPLTTHYSQVQKNQVAELLFKGRRKSDPHHNQVGTQQLKQQSKPMFSSSSSSSLPFRGRTQRNDLLNTNVQSEKQLRNKGDDMRTSWNLLKSGEVSSLIKQGFMERKERRNSPGRVSPLTQEAMVASAEKTTSSLLASIRKINAGNHAHTAQQAVTSSPPPEKQGKSNTLFSMMSRDAELTVKSKGDSMSMPALQRSRSSGAVLDAGIARNPLFNNAERSDVRLVLKSRDGGEVCLNLHSWILVERSKYFAAKLSDAWNKQLHQRGTSPCVLEMEDCEDLEAHQETLHLLYCEDLQARIVKCNVLRVLAILKVAALILFESCIVCCLEYLEAVPWAEEEEEKVRKLLGQLQIMSFTSADVLKRLKTEEGSGSEETLVQLLEMVIKGKDSRARREMKALVSKMLHENSSQNVGCVDLSRESLYHACSTCLDALSKAFLEACKTDPIDRGALIAEISHQADNLLWLLEILLDRHIASDFVKIWAYQFNLALVHKKLATVLRFEVSRLTARLCIAIGRGQVLCPVDVRYALLQTWLSPLLDDFGWMQRCCKGLDKNTIEDGICQTILTLPLNQQQSILLSWFNRFSNNGDDCPNLQRAFEVWWRRTFLRRWTEEQAEVSPT